MTIDIITRYSGEAERSSFEASGDGKHMEIATMDLETGEVNIVFTGEEFSRERFEEYGGKVQEDSYRRGFKFSQ
ncbi:MAG: hypothetical protein ABIG60_04700 [Patescibacteria group bacterium]